MKKFRIGLMLAATAVALPAAADVLTFEDLGGTLGFFRAPYRGFSFGDNNPQSNPWFYTNEVNPYYKPKSGSKYIGTDYLLYPNNASLTPTQPITRATDFVFDGAWFSGAEFVQYKLYLDGRLVHTSAVSAELTNVPQFVASGYDQAIDSVVVLATQGYYGMDDFTFNSAPVPEVGSGALLAGGLLTLGAFLRSRRRAGQA